MQRLIRLLGITFAALYFIFAMGLVIILLLITPLLFKNDVSVIRTSGFAGQNMSVELISVAGLFIGISLLVPVLRKVYDVLPWLFSFIKIFFVSFVILNIGTSILNYGYEINNPTRHTIFYILMIVFVIIGRLAMCFYFWKKPVNIGKEEEHYYER
ncbi:hypothetical protein [Sutcliffiella rhizosphaerae]|uniref:Uncharacterized protein n=1 Tax=Sutcliffiella rhizosphaerae TaxID=2880967 RepID=A0ABM8YSZ8_9BACI|nr:hypothetical protein [Sutcliffiella rhizosphaerae]CAG9623149.1 hypothetical protein BACCIP111883_03945 [Sutcliffiella rhizosphaerae]